MPGASVSPDEDDDGTLASSPLDLGTQLPRGFYYLKVDVLSSDRKTWVKDCVVLMDHEKNRLEVICDQEGNQDRSINLGNCEVGFKDEKVVRRDDVDHLIPAYFRLTSDMSPEIVWKPGCSMTECYEVWADWREFLFRCGDMAVTPPVGDPALTSSTPSDPVTGFAQLL